MEGSWSQVPEGSSGPGRLPQRLDQLSNLSLQPPASPRIASPVLSSCCSSKCWCGCCSFLDSSLLVVRLPRQPSSEVKDWPREPQWSLWAAFLHTRPEWRNPCVCFWRMEGDCLLWQQLSPALFERTFQISLTWSRPVDLKGPSESEGSSFLTWNAPNLCESSS